MRIGHGCVAYPIRPGDKTIVGGVVFTCDFVIRGRGDGDVALQALCDALLGAAGLGDIATAFPVQQHDLQLASSRALLRLTRARLHSLGYAAVNADISVVCPGIALQPKFDAMKQCVAEDLGIGQDCTNIKPLDHSVLPALTRHDGALALSTVLIQHEQ